MMIKVAVWYEISVENEKEDVLEVHPRGLNATIGEALEEQGGFEVRLLNLDMENCGITDELLADIDVLMWWGHIRHHLVPDEAAVKIQQAVNRGMGLVVLHSGHESKPFKRLMGTSCSLRWRDGDYERVWCTDPGHPIAEGVPPCFELECEEMYGEYFDVPSPEHVVFTGWFRGGEVFRSGCCWTRGLGRIFYFQPGHETNKAFYHPIVRRILANSVRWAAPTRRGSVISSNYLAEDVRPDDVTAWYCSSGNKQ